MRPSDFARDDATGEWVIGKRIFRGNPRLLLGAAESEMIRYWLACRPGGMGGARVLPDRGGVGDQAAVMMDALSVMDDECTRVQREDKSKDKQ